MSGVLAYDAAQEYGYTMTNTETQTPQIPQTINNFPVRAAVMSHLAPNVGVVVCDLLRDGLNSDHFVCWRVAFDTKQGQWFAESGVYSETYEVALASLAFRSGITTK